MATEAEFGVMCPRAKDAWNPHKLREGGRTFPWGKALGT